MNGETAWRLAESLAAWAWRASWQGAALAVIVALLLWAVGRRISPGWRFGLWGLVLLRLAMPAVVAVEQRWIPTASQTAAPPTAPSPIVSSAPAAPLDVPVAARSFRPDRASLAPTKPPQAITPASITEPPPARTPFIWAQFKPYAIALWLAGILLLALRVAWSSFRLARAVRRLPIIDENRILRMLDACCTEIGVRHRPAARQLPAGGGAPALVGFLRPTILLPTAILASIGDAELRLILMHELAHVKRHDVLINWLATCVAVLHWPNPAAWAVLWRMRTERELACDEVVLRTDGAGAAYARTIVGLVEAMSAGIDSKVVAAAGADDSGAFRGRVPATSAISPSGAVGILEGKAQIQRRLIMIAQFDAKGRRSLAIAASLGLIVGALSLSGATRAADPPAGGPPPATKTKTVEKGTTAVTESKTTAVPGSDAAGTTNNPNAAGAGSPPPSPVVPTATAVPSGSTVALQSGTFTIAATPPSPEEQKANARTAERLKKPLQKVDFNAVPLSDVIDFLRDATGMDILVEWPALEQAGIPRDAPITIRLREPTPVDALLPLMFRASGLPLRYEIDKGVVVIGPSATTQSGPAVTRVYDVADLVAGAPVPPSPAGFRPGAEGAGGAGGGGLAAPMPEDTSEAGQLIRLITSTIEPASWRDAGGELGSISFFKSKLVVKTSEPIHKEIANLLEMLREKPAGKEKAKAGF